MQLWRYGQPIERLGGRYLLQGSLGSGGMADVCLALDEQMGRQVAIKVIKSEELEQRTLNRFLKEAAQVSHWRHPHILRFYGEARLELVDVAKGSVVPYIVMEYARGGDLYHRLQKGQPYPLAETLALFAQLCSAVSYAHAHGLIHRDLKPQNILFRQMTDGSEQALLSDFGLAVEVSATHHSFARGGTLPYMAPEQLLGKPEPASDIFALGVILYQLCTGRLPFRRTLQDLRRVGPLPQPALATSLNPDLPLSIDAILQRALAEDPGERYESADGLWDELKTIPVAGDGRPSSSSPGTRTQATSARAQQAAPPGTRILTAPARAVSSRNSYPSLPSSSYGTRPGSRSARSTFTYRPPRRPGARLLLLIPCLLIVLLAFFILSIQFHLFTFPFTFMPPVSNPAATVTHASQTLSQSYTLALTHSPSPTADQFTSHTLTTTVTDSRTVATTGKAQTQATQAKGKVAFLNGSFSTPFTIGAGATITGKDGVVVVTDASVTIPIANPNIGDGQALVSAHAGNPGSAGNIVALDINKVCCTSDNSIFVKNADAFTGGQDAQNYHYPTQGDVDQVSGSLQGGLEQKGQQQLQGLLMEGEQLAGEPVCTVKATADQPLGPRGNDLLQVTVLVSSTCQVEAYSSSQLQQELTARLQMQARTKFGGAYQLSGKMQMQTIVESGQGPDALPTLKCVVSGLWRYHFDANQVHEMLYSIVSKSRVQASGLLRSQAGISTVSIQSQYPQSGPQKGDICGRSLSCRQLQKLYLVKPNMSNGFA